VEQPHASIHVPRPLTLLAGDTEAQSVCRCFTTAERENGSPLALRDAKIRWFARGRALSSCRRQ
jgi:hypothetical protein